jgi:hypothetical protein
MPEPEIGEVASGSAMSGTATATIQMLANQAVVLILVADSRWQPLDMMSKYSANARYYRQSRVHLPFVVQLNLPRQIKRHMETTCRDGESVDIQKINFFITPDHLVTSSQLPLSSTRTLEYLFGPS